LYRMHWYIEQMKGHIMCRLTRPVVVKMPACFLFFVAGSSFVPQSYSFVPMPPPLALPNVYPTYMPTRHVTFSYTEAEPVVDYSYAGESR